MKFVDYATIYVKAGHGGKGAIHFRREKYVPRGGPDGGDGGRGGHVIIRASGNLNTLLDFRYKREYMAQSGAHGQKQRMHGKDGEDLLLPVPVGTQIIDETTKEALFDLDHEGAEAVIAKGGRGGQGNQHFATATRQVPRFAQPGEEGEERHLVLELKLLADVGLLGLPNIGKSTLISVISSARPKIADYQFTTLVPNLGVVKPDNRRSFVVADIPGLIEGAHKGVGLGFQFLRHVERTSLLLHLVDISEMGEGDPVDNMMKINRELELFNPDMLLKPQIVVGTKYDIAGNMQRHDRLKGHCDDNNIKFIAISSVTGMGIKKLVSYLSDRLDEARAAKT
ncbi:MAG: GTPase ObgE [Nitrospirae bacterium]|nr:GTPase ObgE [Nitrospirota bacterium]